MPLKVGKLPFPFCLITMVIFYKDKTKKLPLQETRIKYTSREKKQFLLVKSEMTSYDRIVT